MSILVYLGQAVLLAIALFIVVFIILLVHNYREISKAEKSAKIIANSKFVKIERLDENSYAMYDALTNAFLLQAETELQLQKDAYTKFDNLIILK